MHCKEFWGLELLKCDPDATGRRLGDWKTGWMLRGQFPGIGYTWRHFKTLKAIAKATQFEQSHPAAWPLKARSNER